MPIHLDDLDVVSEIEGQRSVLIIPCYMCPAVSVAVRENKPFIQLFSHLFKSAPFEQYIKKLQSVLRKNGVDSSVFKSNLFHQWFLCMWTSSRRKRLKKLLKNYDSAIILGCDSAVETVRDLSNNLDCKVIRGMEAVGFMNAKMKFSLPCNVSFEDCKILPLFSQKTDPDTPN